MGVPIERFDIDPKNKYFKSDGKILYSGNQNNTLHFVSSITSGSFTIPLFVTQVNKNCFRGCTVSNIEIHPNLRSIDQYAFCGTHISTFTYNSLITRIEALTFLQCSNLETVEVNDKIVFIGHSCFQSCPKLKNIRLPSSLVEIGDSAFAGCTVLNDLIIPASLVTMGASVFKDVRSSFVLNYTLNSRFLMENGLFYQDDKRVLSGYFDKGEKAITIRSECTTVSNLVFTSATIQTVTFSNSPELNVGDNVFTESQVKTINFPSTLKKLGKQCFRNCLQLEKVSFPGTMITEIPEECFINCPKLKSITLPKSITTVIRLF
ncbi:surface antigen BspA-like [Trichomonas vaginalis G3]|uniref:Surface antigen BspA-like n=1 Tax=Trichomonas vaginalis (strain ATCC PRA-98 / G3) TaxID=412133 RepID=A2FII4_TRIV3|nr:ribonuclease inhibitor domain-containing protein [Trichomonas vaginalis G3]EAX95301.1 surface antigen BspA-like [Trichomonas vaginalis G3]KAI5539355.1 ribonuclease inhibitor domain-containing protein [Trichomonas vaginalis G3]|eukprot:XP_001308231.1 surface antigen BspA-like [Trichomonas vaginalis G3]